ncbi:50S ribosomal protein L18 [Geothrix oryzae]|jgi:large subunit ribosomal protein L18|uniref:Large ribosomal subunit protein uL18 n=1 Tax=Geothrix oryzae TaxID=2927975 RepID=A0ABN6UZZ4_9BACT|nr:MULTISPECIES: 50S ribosomal protein L18 [Geothrix]BDU70629.1 50S ribosomal protein L18 [Geothrix oryzae]
MANDINIRRDKTKARIRGRVSGTPERPRLTIYKSLKRIYVQAVDDTQGITLAAASSLEKDLRGSLKNGANIEAAKAVGASIAARLKEKGITSVVFDRNGYVYHGRVKALADSAREAGLQF